MQESTYRTDLACEISHAGQKRGENIRKYERHGIPVEEKTLAELRQIARELGVEAI